jgi:hypothetical protein
MTLDERTYVVNAAAAPERIRPWVLLFGVALD